MAIAEETNQEMPLVVQRKEVLMSILMGWESLAHLEDAYLTTVYNKLTISSIYLLLAVSHKMYNLQCPNK